MGGVLFVRKTASYCGGVNPEMLILRDARTSLLPEASRIDKKGYYSAVLLCTNQYCFRTLDGMKVFKASHLQSSEWGLRIFKRYRLHFRGISWKPNGESFSLNDVLPPERASDCACSVASIIFAQVKGEPVSITDVEASLLREDKGETE